MQIAGRQFLQCFVEDLICGFRDWKRGYDCHSAANCAKCQICRAIFMQKVDGILGFAFSCLRRIRIQQIGNIRLRSQG